jgi:hypothetical protein
MMKSWNTTNSNKKTKTTDSPILQPCCFPIRVWSASDTFGRAIIESRRCDFAKIERQWFGEEKGHAGIVVIHNLLSPIVLEKVRDYLMTSTFYYDVKTPRYGRYVGTYMNDGMHDKLVMAIAFELHKATPRVMKGYAMKEMWTYKYESS